MLDKDIFVATLLQLWFLQFIFVFIDVFTNINIAYYGSIIWYSIVINLVVLGYVLFNKLSQLVKILFFLVFLFSLMRLILGFNLFWGINASFILLFLIGNYYRKEVGLVWNRYGKKIIKSIEIDFKSQSVAFLIILFLLQFVFLNLLYSIVINLVLVSLIVSYYIKGNFLRSAYMKVRSNSWQKNLNNVFQLILVIYLIVLLVNEFYSLNSKVLNVLLFLSIVLGILSVIFEDKSIVLVKEANRWDYGFGIILGLIGGVLIYIKTKDLGWLSYVISVISAILIILVSFLILEEDGEEETKSISKA